MASLVSPLGRLKALPLPVCKKLGPRSLCLPNIHQAKSQSSRHHVLPLAIYIPAAKPNNSTLQIFLTTLPPPLLPLPWFPGINCHHCHPTCPLKYSLSEEECRFDFSVALLKMMFLTSPTHGPKGHLSSIPLSPQRIHKQTLPTILISRHPIACQL